MPKHTPKLNIGPLSAFQTIGKHGVTIYGGYINIDEQDRRLIEHETRYRTYSNILANTSIVAAGVRYFVNLVGKSTWTFEPAEKDATGEYAEKAEEIFLSDPLTPWHRIVRRAAMYRFYGFSVHEWTAKKREDGTITFADIAPRAQVTLERWEVLDDGTVEGVYQTSPQTEEEIFLPRNKLLYVVDDTLNDSPEGLGLFRHLVAPATRLTEYERLEGIGFSTDLRGTLVVKAPLSRLQELVTNKEITETQAREALKPLNTFLESHARDPKLGILLDSLTYQTEDLAAAPTAHPLYDVDLMKGGSTSFGENAAAIERLNREMARILGVEQLLLGASNTGSYSLSKDKTNSFHLQVDSAIVEIRAAMIEDLLKPIWAMNGWDKEFMPKVEVEAVRYTDVQQVAQALRDMATAGAVLAPDDPVIAHVRSLMGAPQPEEGMYPMEEPEEEEPPKEVDLDEEKEK